VYDRLIPDEERRYASLAADALGMPIHFLAGDDYAPFTAGVSGLSPSPEPIDEPTPALLADQLAQASANGRVLLSGFGGDPLLHASPTYMMKLLTGFRWLRWFSETARYIYCRRSLPPLGLRSRLKRWFGSFPWHPLFPDWLAPKFVERFDLRLRFEAIHAPSQPPHPRHAEAYQLLSAPFWPALFESLDAGATGRAVDVRHPFFDVRLVKFVLAIPPLPWCANKEILRTSMRGLLPEVIRLRPKTPLAGDPLAERFRQTGSCWADYATPKPRLAPYVRLEQVRKRMESAADSQAYAVSLITRPLCLGYWFDMLESDDSPSRQEETHDHTETIHALARAQEGVSHPEADGVR
jgi:asparagine synthase (glutamine-hydrolysing)